MLRTRWAAIGAAIAVSLGAGGFGLARATSPTGAAAFVPITPCRIFDTRPAFNVGPKSSPLGPGETYTVTGTGTTGDCTTVPTTATGLVLNMTALDASAATFLTVWGDGARPEASSLNPAPGQPPTPNAVTTDLTSAGEFNVYNLAGNVHAFADVVGYYTDHHHDDRYYTRSQTDTRYLTETVFGKTAGFPDVLVPEDEFLVDQTVATTRSGRLLLTMSFAGAVICAPSSDALVYLTIDDVPIPSSGVVVANGSALRTTLTGVTADVIDASVHTLGVAAECVGASTVSSTGSSAASTSSVTVLPTG